jgi:hypothetical protein
MKAMFQKKSFLLPVLQDDCNLTTESRSSFSKKKAPEENTPRLHHSPSHHAPPSIKGTKHPLIIYY